MWDLSSRTNSQAWREYAALESTVRSSIDRPRQKLSVAHSTFMAFRCFRLLAQGPSMMIVRGWDSSMAWRMTNVVRANCAGYACQGQTGCDTLTLVACFAWFRSSLRCCDPRSTCGNR